jgi:cytochrome c biogenesis protein CcmG, thiol:disulfide interchange protein DsbE
MKTRELTVLAAVALLAAVLAVRLAPSPGLAPSPFVERPAPAFSLPQLHHPGQSLSPADLKGQVWMLNVWASWCAPCRLEHPLLLDLSHQKRVPIFGLNYRDDPRNALELLHQLGNPYTASVLDTDGSVGADYRVDGLPTTFVIDKAGVVRFKKTGPLTDKIWEKELRPLILKLQD